MNLVKIPLANLQEFKHNSPSAKLVAWPYGNCEQVFMFYVRENDEQ